MNTAKEDSINKEIENRKKNLIHFFKEKTNLVIYAILAVIISVSVYIRTLPMKINPSTGKPGLWDITTNTWTLGPDLDPFLFLRWAKDIAAHGKLFVFDAMRYIPLADICSGTACNPVNTSQQGILLPTMISWLYHVLSVFVKEVSVTYAAIIFPVVMSVLMVIAFFLFAKKLFYKEDKKIAGIIALISTAFFVLIPSLLPRTIAGIPEKESAGFAFVFLALYFFLEAFTSDKLKRGLIFGALSGIATAVLGLVWGGVTLVFVVIAAAVFLEFVLGKINKNKFYIFSVWILSFTLILSPISLNYSLRDLMESSSTALCFVLFFIMFIDFIIFDKKLFKINEKIKKIKLPSQFLSIILGGIILALLATAIFGLSFIPGIVNDFISSTVHPLFLDRFSITVAENAQPYFLNDWLNNFGPVFSGIPLYFWLFFSGAVVLFAYTIKSLEKKEKRILTASYILLLICLIFSKYSSGSALNGDSTLSLLVYFGGALCFVGSLVYVYYKRHKEGKLSEFLELNFGYILYTIALTIMIIAARGAVRLTMVLGAISPIVVGFLIVKTGQRYFKEKEDFNKLLIGLLVLVLLVASVFTAFVYYQSDKNMAQNYIPGLYQWQWQGAMSWVRDNTPANAVFAHWWDYGYWVQSIGERATVLDGGNAIGYWNYFMGRNVLTATNEKDALDFLYAHNTTNLLIDSTDIGKYGAFSSIGSNSNYDRYSWIPTVLLDDSQTQEKDNQTTYVYPIGSSIDQDIILQDNGKEILLPEKKAAIIAITVSIDKNGNLLQPEIYFGYNNQQYQMPLKIIYINGKEYDFNSGFDAGIFIFPRVDQKSGQFGVVANGAALYLSPRTVHSNLANLYLFNKQSDYFKLVHSEDNLFVKNMKQQGMNIGDLVYYQGLQGPIKIWQVSYPSDEKINPIYLDINSPADIEKVVQGKY